MAKDERVRGSISNIFEIFILDSRVTTGAGLTGLAFGTSGLKAFYKYDNGSAAVVISPIVTMTAGTFSSGGFVEISSANVPGLYDFCVPDAAFSSTTARFVTIMLSGAANMMPVIIEVALKGADTQVPQAATVVLRGNLASGSGQTLTLGSNASTAFNDFYKGNVIVLTGGTGAGKASVITAYSAGTLTVTTELAMGILDATTTYAILPAGGYVTSYDPDVSNQIQSDVVIGLQNEGTLDVSGNVFFTPDMNNAIADAILARSLGSESYAANGVVPTVAQMLFMLWSSIGDFSISGTTITCRKLNGTTSMTFSLDSAITPTSRLRAT